MICIKRVDGCKMPSTSTGEKNGIWKLGDSKRGSGILRCD